VTTPSVPFASEDIAGIVFLDKPHGWTSRRAVNEVIRLFSVPGHKRIKAGHAGTLDPLATGMLPILVGDATRFADMGLNAEKTYLVSFDLSCQTDTLDKEGEVTERFHASISQQQFEAILPEFLGEIAQVPPIYSAIRMDGKRAHDLAREGKQVQMQSRQVTLHSVRLRNFSFPQVRLEVRCSKGTYIRSLARDMGARLGMGGCVTELRRVSTGGWPEAMMVSHEQLANDKAACLLPLAQWLRDFKPQRLSLDEGKRFLQGQRIQIKGSALNTAESDVAVFGGELLLGTGVLKPGMRYMVLHPAKILPSAQKRLL